MTALVVELTNEIQNLLDLRASGIPASISEVAASLKVQ
jgi:hypothetical protein